ncbi:hypothetical protein [Actinopolymorpha pittospori]|uniref:Phage antirepressor YoqD-like protein n=1 Tax=Actinopolymorpha pittospori TaxID=648752 RepID=A0A927MPZ7_9ACTN|nr:hypothetical protein [Actinopolymorpha pittospori]MBE1604746.1 phage antirepressor YoqD-like protein [Actinopolymorpha pittospori]
MYASKSRLPSPRCKSWDVLAWAEGGVGGAETAKDLSRDLGIRVGRDRLFALLGDDGWIYRAGLDGRGGITRRRSRTVGCR